nr:unnamed protein product [Callosobruchus analis]
MKTIILQDLNRYNGFLSNWVRLYENNDADSVVADESIENMLERYHRVRKRSANADDATANGGTTSTTAPSNFTAVQTSFAPPNNETFTNPTVNNTEPMKTIDVSPPLNLNITESASKNITVTAESTESTPNATKPTNANGTNTTTNSTASPKAETTTLNVTVEAINSTATVNITKPADTAKEVEIEIKQSDKNVTEHKHVLGESTQQINSTTVPLLSTNQSATHLKTFADDKKARKATEKEHLDHHQSGNAVLTNGDKTMSETDVSLGKAAAHASVSTGPGSASPKEGASSSAAAASTGNDTKIIIFLGVAVVVVGVAAVGYNYSRKKRRTNSGRARAGQNGDVEIGREMKPLMRLDPEVDTKKEAEVNAEENK